MYARSSTSVCAAHSDALRESSLGKLRPFFIFFYFIFLIFWEKVKVGECLFANSVIRNQHLRQTFEVPFGLLLNMRQNPKNFPCLWRQISKHLNGSWRMQQSVMSMHIPRFTHTLKHKQTVSLFPLFISLLKTRSDNKLRNTHIHTWIHACTYLQHPIRTMKRNMGSRCYQRRVSQSLQRVVHECWRVLPQPVELCYFRLVPHCRQWKKKRDCQCC